MQKSRIDAAVVNDAAGDLSMDYSVPRPVSPQSRPAVSPEDFDPRLSQYTRIQGHLSRAPPFSDVGSARSPQQSGNLLGTRTRPGDCSTCRCSRTEIGPILHRLRLPRLRRARRDAGATDGSTSQSILKSDTGASTVRSFTYVVQPKDTLRELCVSNGGDSRYDNAVRAKIRQLNPNLKKPRAS